MKGKSLDALDPPAWAPPPDDATTLILRCHKVRTKPVDSFDSEDMRLMIGQQIGLTQLVPLALQRLDTDSLASGDVFAGDLVMSMLRIEAGFWIRYPGLAAQLLEITTNLLSDPDRVAGLDPRTRDEISEARDQLVADDHRMPQS